MTASRQAGVELTGSTVREIDTVLRQHLDSPGPFEVLRAYPNPRAGVYESDLLEVRSPAGNVSTVLLKRGPATPTQDRPGIAVEADVYRHVLPLAAVRRPAFYGEFAEAESGRMCMLLEYLDDALRADEDSSNHVDSMSRAAHWIGGFHATCESVVKHLSRLPRLDESHYARMADRAEQCTRELRSEFPWVSDVCEGIGKLTRLLEEDGLTVIHGDYFADNVLLCDGSVHPVDWEWCARGPGVVDLAALTNRWPEVVVRQCKAAYRRARGGNESEKVFETRVTAARLYLCLRYMAVSRDFAMADHRRWRFTALRDHAQTLGLL